MFRYLRQNQSIQISVDSQVYLPSLSPVTDSNIGIGRSANSFYLLVGTPAENNNHQQRNSGLDPGQDTQEIPNYNNNYTLGQSSLVNYFGCISNLQVRMGNLLIEPLSEAFGQHFETISIGENNNNNNTVNMVNNPSQSMIKESGKEVNSMIIIKGQSPDHSRYIQSDSDEPLVEKRAKARALNGGASLQNSQYRGPVSRLLDIVNRLGGNESSDGIETILIRDVEQGKCASFKRREAEPLFVETQNKKSNNEPKHTPVSEVKFGS